MPVEGTLLFFLPPLACKKTRPERVEPFLGIQLIIVLWSGLGLDIGWFDYVVASLPDAGVLGDALQ